MATPTSSANELAALLKEIAEQGRINVTVAPDLHHRFERILATPPPPDSPEISVVLRCRFAFNLTVAEALVLAQLVKYPQVATKQLHKVMSRDGKPATDIGIVGTVVSLLRKKMTLHEIKIVNIPSYGYRLIESDRARIRKLIADEHDEDAVSATALANDPKTAA
jgi:hypothetical protein